MEQPCHKCGQAVEEGVAFCPHCSAPQIRVVIAEPTPVPAAVADGAARLARSTTLPASETVPVMAIPMGLSQTLKPCALAAVVASLLMFLGLNPFVAMLSVGFLAVFFYRQRQPGTAIRAGIGARLGAFSGLLWFGVSFIFQGLGILVLRKGPELREEMLKKIQQTAASANDPQVQAFFDYFKTPAGLAVMIVMGLIFAFLAALALGALGGALGGTLFGRRHKQ
jgi:hypothetical protein